MYALELHLPPVQFEEAKAKRERIRAHVEGLLGSNGLLLLPTAPGPAIKLQTPEQEVDTFRNGVLRLTCTAGLCGLPQVHSPGLHCHVRVHASLVLTAAAGGRGGAAAC